MGKQVGKQGKADLINEVLKPSRLQVVQYRVSTSRCNLFPTAFPILFPKCNLDTIDEAYNRYLLLSSY